MKKKKKEKSTELQKPNVEAEVYNNNKNKKYDREENKIKSLIKLHSANKINNYKGGDVKGKEKSKINPKNPQNRSKYKNNKCFS